MKFLGNHDETVLERLTNGGLGILLVGLGAAIGFLLAMLFLLNSEIAYSRKNPAFIDKGFKNCYIARKEIQQTIDNIIFKTDLTKE